MRRLPRILASTFFAMVVAALYPTLAHAGSDGFRCPCTGRVIDVKSSTYDVSSLCREPDFASHRVEHRADQRALRRFDGKKWLVFWEVYEYDVEVENWVYDFGKSRLIENLRFENGYLVAVATGPRGVKDDE